MPALHNELTGHGNSKVTTKNHPSHTWLNLAHACFPLLKHKIRYENKHTSFKQTPASLCGRLRRIGCVEPKRQCRSQSRLSCSGWRHHDNVARSSRRWAWHCATFLEALTGSGDRVVSHSGGSGVGPQNSACPKTILFLAAPRARGDYKETPRNCVRRERGIIS
jgi:hypothetical protein